MKKALSIAIFLATATHAQAAEIYDCSFDGSSNSGWIADRVIVSHDKSTGSALALNTVVAAFNDGKPTEAEVTAQSAKRFRVKWEVRVKGSDGQGARMSYILTYFPRTEKASVSASPLGYSNRFIEWGTCEILEGTLE